MKPLTEEWVKKADADFKTAQRELAVEVSPNCDAVCFHAQQCAEKYLKARLVEEDISFTRTHDLTAILDLVISIESDWESFRNNLISLTDCAVEVRYPGCFADIDDAQQAFQTSQQVRKTVRRSLGLK